MLRVEVLHGSSLLLRGGAVLQPHHSEEENEYCSRTMQKSGWSELPIAAVNCWPRVVLLLHVLQISGFPEIRMNQPALMLLLPRRGSCFFLLLRGVLQPTNHDDDRQYDNSTCWGSTFYCTIFRISGNLDGSTCWCCCCDEYCAAAPASSCCCKEYCSPRTTTATANMITLLVGVLLSTALFSGFPEVVGLIVGAFVTTATNMIRINRPAGARIKRSSG